MKTNEVMRFNSSYKNIKTNNYRVFLNLPTWVGMKVYEISKYDSAIRINFLAECLYQGNNQEVARLYDEIVLHNSNEWIEVDFTEILIGCINCTVRDCILCDNFIL